MSQVLGPLKIYTEDINSMIDDLSSAGVKTSAIAIAASVFITYFVEMYQKTSAEVSTHARMLVKIYILLHAVFVIYCE